MYYNVNGSDFVNHLHTVETATSGYTLAYLDFIFFLSILFTMLVIISKNPVVSVLYLIGLFINVACYLILLGMSFLGLSYLLVYVGAVSILFLFILMLINVRISELVTENTNSLPLILTIPVLFSYSIQKTLNITSLIIYDNTIYNSNTLFNIIYGVLYGKFKYSYMYNKTNDAMYVTSNM